MAITRSVNVHTPYMLWSSISSTGKGGAKKGDAAATATGGGSGSGGGGAAGARRANVSELKGLVEVCAACQAKRAGASAVTGEGRPLLQVRPKIEALSNHLCSAL